MHPGMIHDILIKGFDQMGMITLSVRAGNTQYPLQIVCRDYLDSIVREIQRHPKTPKETVRLVIDIAI